MNELIPDKLAYQVNKRRMAWSALGMMIVTTIATLVRPPTHANTFSPLSAPSSLIRRNWPHSIYLLFSVCVCLFLRWSVRVRFVFLAPETCEEED